MQNTVVIRNATRDDCASITDNLFLVMEDLFGSFIEKKDSVVTKSLLSYFVEQEQNQYSYQNCLVAEIDGKVVATLNSYNGGDLILLREPVLSYIKPHFNNHFNPEDETQEGEYYIDSLGVNPQWQGKGIGTELLKYVIEQHVTKNNHTIGLLVENDNQPAKKLYLKLGFKPVGNKMLVGKRFEHLQIKP